MISEQVLLNRSYRPTAVFFQDILLVSSHVFHKKRYDLIEGITDRLIVWHVQKSMPPLWMAYKLLFTDDFHAHVENVMKRKPHPKAKPLGVFSIEDIS